ncbi:N-acetyl-gamma-glutamyl-phosphate reductase [Membranihabitans maritimus]|uniref:N-acetyl-gamma-glutamyl-phosphate reductase n=1 Tax=Membranihabitans maritimus TaxID=2904244 RepID=UPI001F00378D|nr:N-acetyl-gamma-glutamyl-phosphate reductase [Membranihabitans maritimus]
MKVAIAGGAGYTGGELLRLLVHHPEIQITQVLSNSQAGKPVTDIHPDLLGSLDIEFSPELTENFDCIFLCMGHGRSGKFLQEINISSDKIVIDLSNEFRFEDGKHSFTYGLPEWQKDKIANSTNIANPGCFATTIQLGLLPLASSNLIRSDIHVTAITGSTGAGQSLSPTSHFSWRNNNVSIYKLFTHQHIPEIQQSAKALQNTFDKEIYMVPVRGNFSRGILASIYLDNNHLDKKDVNDLYSEYYSNHPFVKVTSNNLDVKQVVNTNFCFLKIELIKDKIHITSILDNLIKGASGQAVQNLNIIAGWPEETGLLLKASAF